MTRTYPKSVQNHVWHSLFWFFVEKTDASKLNNSILGVFKTLPQIYMELFAMIKAYVAQKIKFSIKDFFCKCGQSAVSCGYGHIYWRYPYWKTSVISGTNFLTKMQLWVNPIQKTVSNKYQLNLQGTIYRIWYQNCHCWILGETRWWIW